MLIDHIGHDKGIVQPVQIGERPRDLAPGRDLLGRRHFVGDGDPRQIQGRVGGVPVAGPVERHRGTGGEGHLIGRRLEVAGHAVEQPCRVLGGLEISVPGLGIGDHRQSFDLGS